MESGHEPAYCPGGKARQYKQWKYFCQNARERRDEGDSCLRIKQRDGKRHKYGYCQIYDYGVHDHLRHITSKFACNNCAGGGRRTNHAEHSRFKQDTVCSNPYGSRCCAVHGPDYGEAESQEGRYLDDEVAYMPFSEYKLTGLYAAETDKEHEEQQNGLNPAADGLQNGTGGVD